MFYKLSRDGEAQKSDNHHCLQKDTRGNVCHPPIITQRAPVLHRDPGYLVPILPKLELQELYCLAALSVDYGPVVSAFLVRNASSGPHSRPTKSQSEFSAWQAPSSSFVPSCETRQRPPPFSSLEYRLQLHCPQTHCC